MLYSSNGVSLYNIIINVLVVTDLGVIGVIVMQQLILVCNISMNDLYMWHAEVFDFYS